MKLEKTVFLVSKLAGDLTQALNENPQAVTIWVRSGKNKNKFPLLRSSIVYEAKSKIEVGDYKKKFVSTLSIPKTHTRLSVLKGISTRQISQLIIYTRRDKFIRTNTHDFDHFKSKKTLLAWKRRGKVIYTLINRTGKLLGIIWFNKKRIDGFKEKLMVRIYPPARGKKVARKFLNIVQKYNYLGD
jgi:hypothetical protein